MKLNSIRNLYPPIVRRFIKKIKAMRSFSASPYLNRASVKFQPNRKNIVAGNHWDLMLNQILEEINTFPMSFLRTPVISRTVHPDQQILGKLYFDELLNSDLFTRRILPMLQDPPMGNPYLCEFFPLTSPMSIQHVYYIDMIYKKMGFFVPDNQIGHIVEVGGGYGNLARLFRNFGYEGTHCILDLPEMQSMQQHYLAHVLPVGQQQSISYKSIGDRDVVRTDVPSLLIATFSISEMPLATRHALEDYYKDFNYLFFAYNAAFDGVDNLEYFSGLQHKLSSDFSTNLFKDDYRSAWFLLCERK